MFWNHPFHFTEGKTEVQEWRRWFLLPCQCPPAIVSMAREVSPSYHGAHAGQMNLIHLFTGGLTQCPPPHTGAPHQAPMVWRKDIIIYTPTTYFNVHRIFLLSSALKPSSWQCWNSQHFPHDVTFLLVRKALHKSPSVQLAGNTDRAVGGLLGQPFLPKPRGHFPGPLITCSCLICHFPAVWPWAQYLTSLNLSFLICKIDNKASLTALWWGWSKVMYIRDVHGVKQQRIFPK